MSNHTLTAISPLDGRYAKKVEALSDCFSEYGLMKARLLVEVRWFQALSACKEISEVPAFEPSVHDFLESIVSKFSSEESTKVKNIEKTTNHDVKAIEYYLKERMADHAALAPYIEFVHFACTSEDINNLAYAFMLKTALEDTLLPALDTLTSALATMAKQYAAIPMLSRTHGQAASPTTVGKELMNVLARLKRQKTALSQIPFMGKCNGAVGNYNAHCIAYPEVNWIQFSESVVKTLGLELNLYTTQIEPHDTLAEVCDAMARINRILINACRDLWGYISLDYFKLRVLAHETGSSTMPHKVNPIDFENAEGNLGLANALLHHFSEKLPISRWQRDLSDSTVLRNLGSAFAYGYLAWANMQQGLSKLEINTIALEADLNAHWEVLGEAIQTVMRRYQLPTPYEQLKNLTRGQTVTPHALHQFIDTLALPPAVKTSLKTLKPQSYTGLAEKLVI